MNQTSNSSHMTERPLTDFHTYYRKKIRPYLIDLEHKRERFLNTSRIHERNYLVASALIGLVLASVTVIMDLFSTWSWGFAIVMLILPVIVMKYWIAPVIHRQKEHDDKHEEFYNRYKSKVVESIVRFFDSSLRLKYSSQVSKETVRKSQLIQDLSSLKLNGDDFVSGFIHKVPISFSELQLTHTGKHKKNDIFHGVFFSAVLKHKFNGTLFIIPKPLLSSTKIQAINGDLYDTKPLLPYHRAHNIRVMQERMRLSNAWSIGNTNAPLEEVSADHVEAMVNYAVFSSHPQHVKSMFARGFWDIFFPQKSASEQSESLLNALSHEEGFKESVSKGYCISIIGDELYIMQPQGGDLFEPDMEQTFLDEEGFTNYHDHLRQAFDIIQYLNKEIKLNVKE